MSGNKLRLLALDGGGVRGLSALMILEQLMDTVNPDAPPKPCDYFDMIGGTSTGGLIAIMLGRLQMSIDECIDAYLKLSGKVFRKTKSKVTVRGMIQGRFDSDELRRAVEEIIESKGLPADALLKDAPDAACKVFVCATSKETSETVCLTSYRSPRGNTDLLKSVKIWEACRATSAASSFFDPISIGRYSEEFVDGATGANNPVTELWNQAQLIWGTEPLEAKVQCLVSIGTGIPTLKPFDDDLLHIGRTLVAISTETEQTAERFRRDKAFLDQSSRYFRFNVVRGLEDIGLEESTKAKDIAAATRRYVASQETFNQMQTCAGNLRCLTKYESSDLTKYYAAFFPNASSLTASGQGLIDAAKEGDDVLVKELLEKGVDVNSKDIAGMTSFRWAVYLGHAAVVKLLVETGKVNIDAKGQHEVTPLYLAAVRGHLQIVQLLLETGKVDVNARGRGGLTPLSFAAFEGNEPMVKLLLQSDNVEIDARDKKQLTPLHYAALNGHVRVVQLLLETGKVDVDVRDHAGMTPLSYATIKGHEPMVKLLQQLSKAGD